PGAAHRRRAPSREGPRRTTRPRTRPGNALRRRRRRDVSSSASRCWVATAVWPRYFLLEASVGKSVHLKRLEWARQAPWGDKGSGSAPREAASGRGGGPARRFARRSE